MIDFLQAAEYDDNGQIIEEPVAFVETFGAVDALSTD